mmetsp:Transcript_28698/g.32177  ORF Transcript_28698/g.32177 Transcript_28698/m.32177 type:complete len:109 (+) Transcript_28698:1194-1520(+)
MVLELCGMQYQTVIVVNHGRCPEEGTRVDTLEHSIVLAVVIDGRVLIVGKEKNKLVEVVTKKVFRSERINWMGDPPEEIPQEEVTTRGGVVDVVLSDITVVHSNKRGK